MSAAKQLYEAALALPPEEREELAAKLVESLAGADIPGVLGPTDMPEIRRRAADAKAGATGVPLHEVRAKLFSK
ncbi:MAG: addiction module protein [Polyangiaceae bacterium]